MSSFAIVQASQLVTLAGPRRARVGRELSELGIVSDGGMLVCDGKIEMVGPTNEIKKHAADAETIDAHGKVVLPGFVDAHTHLVFAGNRVVVFVRRGGGATY
jgi:imidazolonepropionase